MCVQVSVCTGACACVCFHSLLLPLPREGLGWLESLPFQESERHMSHNHSSHLADLQPEARPPSWLAELNSKCLLL